MMLRSLLCADEGRRRQKERGPSKAIKPRLFILETHISNAFSFVVCMYVCALVRQRGPSFINFRRSFSMHPKAPPSSLLSCFLVFTAFQFIPPPLSTHIKTRHETLLSHMPRLALASNDGSFCFASYWPEISSERLRSCGPQSVHFAILPSYALHYTQAPQQASHTSSGTVVRSTSR